MIVNTSALAHSGRTDSNGGHNCSNKSIQKGLCTGYHYHNSGKSSSSTNSTSTKSKATSSSKNKSTSKSSKAKEIQTSSVKLSVDGSIVALSNKPLVKNNSTYFPIREVANEIGASISFNDNKTEVTLSKEDNKVTFKLSSNDIITQNSTTYAPIRSIVEQLGGKVSFDQKKNTIFVEFE
nr:copper amine oxidase N-terminal domain-containing protein [Paenibacillus camelliae]